MGSRCFVIESGKTYALNSEGLWKIVPSSSGSGLSDNAVLTTSQSLTPEQQAQARENISALTSKGLTSVSPGDLIKVKSVGPGGVPTAWEKTSLEELEGQWELVEDFTFTEAAVFLRNKEPNGSPYKFNAIRYTLYLKAPYDFIGTVAINVENQLGSIPCGYIIANSSDSEPKGVVYPFYGKYTSEYTQRSNTRIWPDLSRIYMTYSTNNKIEGFYINNPISSGSRIIIEAVRA